MKREKIIVEIDKTRNECQGNRMSSYKDKLRKIRKDVDSEIRGGRDDLQGQGRK